MGVNSSIAGSDYLATQLYTQIKAIIQIRILLMVVALAQEVIFHYSLEQACLEEFLGRNQAKIEV
jgi:hypothetical protein